MYPSPTHAVTVTTLAGTPATPASNKCPKCAINNAGNPTCCARGGSWFKNCGISSDSTVDHTWDEGLQACKGTVMGANNCSCDVRGSIDLFRFIYIYIYRVMVMVT